LVNIVRDVFPLDRGVALLFHIFPLLREPLEPLGDLLAAGRQVLQGNDLLLIGINAARSWPLHMLALDADAVSLVLALLLLPVLDGLPQGLFLQHDLRVLEQRTDQGPHQGIETVGTYTPGGATFHATHR
jgi:hypothetical protein